MNMTLTAAALLAESDDKIAMKIINSNTFDNQVYESSVKKQKSSGGLNVVTLNSSKKKT